MIGDDKTPRFRQDRGLFQLHKPAMLHRSLAALAFVMGLGAAMAQTAPVEFPPNAKPLAAEALTARLAGKVFNVKTAGGATWRLQFQASGVYFINVGGYSDNGKWRAEESGLCTEPQKRPAACNEMRLAIDALYMKRDSGEIVTFEAN